MSERQPRPISAVERRARHARVARIARRLGFVGRVEYRHVYSRTGGAQYGLGISPEQDLLIVYAEAFERDADPDDFSLEAILAHERGHQILSRHPWLAPRVAGTIPSMMGPKTAQTIRSQLATALARTGKDPILWLEERIRQLEKDRKPEPGELDVLQALCRVLKGTKKSKPQRRRVQTKSAR